MKTRKSLLKMELQTFSGNRTARLAEIDARRVEIRNLLDGDGQVDLAVLQTELRALDDEELQLEQRATTAAGIKAGTISANPIPKPAGEQRSFEGMERDAILATPEYRSAYLKNLQGKDLNELEKRALTTAAGSAGPAVPTTTLNMIIDKLRQTSVLFPRITVSYVPGNLSMVVANAKNAAAWKAEGTAGTPADDTVIAVNLTGFELIKLVEISAAAAAMTIDAFEAYIAAELGRQMAIAIENVILNGTGTNQPTGILPGITWTAANNVTIPVANAWAYDQIVDALALLPTMYHNGAVFVMSRKTLFGGIRKIKGTDGQPIFAYNAQDKAAMTLLGYPVVMDDYIADDIIVLGDYSYYYMNFSQAPGVEASREAGFTSGKIMYRGLAVADGKPALAEAFVKMNKV